MEHNRRSFLACLSFAPVAAFFSGLTGSKAAGDAGKSLTGRKWYYKGSFYAEPSRYDGIELPWVEPQKLIGGGWSPIPSDESKLTDVTIPYRGMQWLNSMKTFAVIAVIDRKLPDFSYIVPDHSIVRSTEVFRLPADRSDIAIKGILVTSQPGCSCSLDPIRLSADFTIRYSYCVIDENGKIKMLKVEAESNKAPFSR